MAKVSELLKVMITTEKADFGSYSHFTENVNDKEKDVLYKVCKYEAAAPLNGSRTLQHSTVFHNNILYHVYYKHYQVIGFDKKGRPSSNLISTLFLHSLSPENCDLLNRRLESMVFDLDRHKSAFIIHKYYTINFFHDIRYKLMSAAASFRKSYKYILLGLLGVLLFILFVNLEKKEMNNKHIQTIEKFEQKTFFEELEEYNANLSNPEYLKDMNDIIVRKGNEIAYNIKDYSDFRSFLRSFHSADNSPNNILKTIRSTPIYSIELENKIIYFAKLEKEYENVKTSGNIRKMKNFLKKYKSELNDQDKVVLQGMIEELVK